MNQAQDIDSESQIYWIRTNAEGRITAALVEHAFTKSELEDELKDMRRFGEVKRVLASRVTIGEELKRL